MLLGFRARYHACNRPFLLLSHNGSCTTFLVLLSFWAVDGLWGSVRLLVCLCFFLAAQDGALKIGYAVVATRGLLRCFMLSIGNQSTQTSVVVMLTLLFGNHTPREDTCSLIRKAGTIRYSRQPISPSNPVELRFHSNIDQRSYSSTWLHGISLKNASSSF